MRAGQRAVHGSPGGAYRLDTAGGTLDEGRSWSVSSTTSRTSPAGRVSLPTFLASTAFTPGGSYLGVVSGPETTASC